MAITNNTHLSHKRGRIFVNNPPKPKVALTPSKRREPGNLVMFKGIVHFVVRPGIWRKAERENIVFAVKNFALPEYTDRIRKRWICKYARA